MYMFKTKQRQPTLRQATERVQELQEQLKEGLDELRLRYRHMDREKKKKIVAGMASLAAIFALTKLIKKRREDE